MEVGAKLRELRIAKNLSQGDIEKQVSFVPIPPASNTATPSLLLERLKNTLARWKFLCADSLLTRSQL